MAKHRKKNRDHKKDDGKFIMPSGIKRWVWGIVFLIFSLVIAFSFFNASGVAGSALNNLLNYLVGKTVILMPLILVFVALVFFYSRYRKFSFPLSLATVLLIIGITGILGGLDISSSKNYDEAEKTLPGGWIGYLLSSLLVKLFGFWISQIIFIVIALVGALIFWHLVKRPHIPKPPKSPDTEEVEKKPTFIKQIFAPKLTLREVPPLSEPKRKEIIEKSLQEEKIKAGTELKDLLSYKPLPLDLLEADKGEPASGDTKNNSAIIKKTLQNFDIPVEMSEVHIGPTVTQYTLKPAEGVKLSKITALSNDLSLSLAAHPIRIEAPIPGRALVGIEIPNKTRSQVRLRNLFSSPNFQLSSPGLSIALGRDVAGNPIFTDLARMPHMLVAGSTGSGKTIFLNTLLLNLLYKNSPTTLRLILVDPKRVEFPVYSSLPHLLCPVIYNAALTCNAL
ncbi:MAG: translocase FtsK protein, partial [Candidatus Daviesbacteria bacterium GW2011_GWB1_41_5]